MRQRVTRHLPSVIALLGLLVAPASSMAVSAPLAPGDLIKSPASSAVYEIADDGSRLVFQMQSVYESWYDKDFSRVRTLSEADLASIPLRRVKSFKPGSVVKSPSLPKVYTVSDVLQLKSIANESDFKKLGFSFSQVKDIPDAFFTSYKVVGEATVVNQEPTTPPSPAPVSTPEPTPEPAFEVTSRSFTATGRQTGTVRVESSVPSSVALSYAPVSSPELMRTQKSDSARTTHDFTLLDLTSRTKYAYTLAATKHDNSLIIQEKGTFVTYYDLFMSGHGSAPTNGSIKQPDLEVGKFFVYNNATTPYHISEFWLQFSATNSATDKVPRTIRIIDVTPGSELNGTVITYKEIATGTNIRNSQNLQKFTFLDIPVEPSKHRIFSVVITNLDSVNPVEFDNSSFVTSIERIVMTGDPEIYLDNNVIGTRYHTLP